MNTHDPSISIITSVLNGISTLGRYLESLAEQTCEDWEAVVMDGGSTDGTVELLEEHEGLLTHWESRPDRGIYDAWNRGLEHARGDWVCFLGADDFLWRPDSLEGMRGPLAGALPEHRVVYGRVNVVDEEGEVVQELGRPWEEVREAMRENMALPNPGTFYHRSLFEEHGGFDLDFRIAGDYEFALRELLQREALFVPDVVVAGMGAGGASQERRRAVALAREVARAHSKHGLARTPPALSPRVWRVRLHRVLDALIGEERALRVVNAWRRLWGRPRL